MRYTFTICVLFIASLAMPKASLAQEKELSGLKFGLGVGTSSYFGDLKDVASISTDFSQNDISFGGEAFVAYELLPYLDVRLQFLGSRLRGINDKFADGNGVYFNSTIMEPSLNLDLDVLGFSETERKLGLQIGAGIGYVLSSPMTYYLIDDSEFDGYSGVTAESNTLVLSAGGALTYDLNQQWALRGANYMRFAFSDQVDGFEGLNGSERAPSANDIYNFTTLGIVYRFAKKDQPLPEEPLIAESTYAVNGAFEYQNQPKQGVKLDLYDAGNKKLASTVTDINGNFKFKNLDENKGYVVKISDDNKDLFNGSSLYLLNDKGQKVVKGDKPEFNHFSFNSLDGITLAGKPELIEEKDLSSMKGVFVYESLPKAGVMVYLVDENDNIIDSTITRTDGTFEFSKLRPDQSYFVKLNEKEGNLYDGGNVFFTNAKDEPIMKGGKQEAGKFSFKAMDEEEIATLLPLDENSSTLIKREKVKEAEIDVSDPDKVDPTKSEPSSKYAGNVSFEKETIYFRHNSFWISQNQQGTKGSVIAEKLKANPKMRIQIEGWASPPGSDEYNLLLSQRRADKLKDLLVTTYGIDASRIEAVGKGEVQEKMSEEEARKARIVVIK